MKDYRYAKIAYEAYCEKLRWQSGEGLFLSGFDTQSAEVQTAWQAAVAAILVELVSRQSILGVTTIAL